VQFDGDWINLLNALISLLQLQSNDEDQKPTYVSYIRDLVVDTSQTKIKGKAQFDLQTTSFLQRF